MKITFEPDVDVVHISLADALESGEASAPGLNGLVPPGHHDVGEINLSFSDDGRLVGIEIVGATRLLRPEVLAGADQLT